MNIQIKISNKRVPYIKAMKYMEKRVNDIKLGKGKELLWILEHPTTYTAGIRSRKDEINDGKLREKILENSPNKNDEFFIVPKVIE